MTSIDTSYVLANALQAAIITERGGATALVVVVAAFAFVGVRVLGGLLAEAVSAVASLAATSVKVAALGVLAALAAVALLFGGGSDTTETAPAANVELGPGVG